MSLSIRFVQLCLLLLSLSGFYFIWYLCLNNGTVDKMKVLSESGVNVPLTGTSALYKRDYTGYEAIDYRLTVLVCVFWEVIDGSHPGAALHGFDFAGQGAVAWPLMAIEWMRAGNRGGVLSYVVVWGLLLQNLSFAIIVPIVLTLHLSTSPTLKPVTSNIVTDVSETMSILFSMIGGFIIPTILMLLPAPSVITYEQKQIFMSLWQVFPLNVSLLQQIFKRLGRLFFPDSTRNTKSNVRGALRAAYAFSLGVGTIVRISTLALSITSLLIPQIFAKGYPEQWHLWNVFVPATVTADFKVADIGQGIFLLFQYDEMIGSTAILLWATTVYVAAGHGRRSFFNWIKLFLGIALMTVLSGPCGAAMALIWARDEQVLQDKGTEPKKIQ